MEINIDTNKNPAKNIHANDICVKLDSIINTSGFFGCQPTTGHVNLTFQKCRNSSYHGKLIALITLFFCANEKMGYVEFGDYEGMGIAGAIKISTDQIHLKSFYDFICSIEHIRDAKVNIK